MGLLDTLARFHDFPVPPAGHFGGSYPDLMVIHYTAGSNDRNDDGSGTANYCRSNPSHYRWHWTIGATGDAWRHLSWSEMGVHDAGINSRAVGIEHCGNGATDWSDRMIQLGQSAIVTASFCQTINRKPSRSFIIGHAEDARFGGISTHTDPGPRWPWDRYLVLVEAAYEGREEDFLMGLDFKDKDDFGEFVRSQVDRSEAGQFVKGQLAFEQGEPEPKDHGAKRQGWQFASKVAGKTPPVTVT